MSGFTERVLPTGQVLRGEYDVQQITDGSGHVVATVAGCTRWFLDGIEITPLEATMLVQRSTLDCKS